MGESINDNPFLRFRKCSIVQLRNCPGGITAEQVADFLWSNVGINVPPEAISIAPHDSNPYVTVAIPRREMADWLNRALQGRSLGAGQVQVLPSPFGLRN